MSRKSFSKFQDISFARQTTQLHSSAIKWKRNKTRTSFPHLNAPLCPTLPNNIFFSHIASVELSFSAWRSTFKIVWRTNFEAYFSAVCCPPLLVLLNQGFYMKLSAAQIDGAMVLRTILAEILFNQPAKCVQLAEHSDIL